MATEPALRATANPALTQSGVTLIAAPGAGYAIVVTDIFVSASAATTISLEDGATVLWRQYVAASGGSVNQGQDEMFRVSENVALTYSASAAVADVFLAVTYRVESV